MKHVEGSSGPLTLLLPGDPHPLDARQPLDRPYEVPADVGANAKAPSARWMHSWTLLAPVLDQIGALREGARRGWKREANRAQLSQLLERIQRDPETGWPASAPSESSDPRNELQATAADVCRELAAALEALPSVHTNTWAAVHYWLRWTSEGRVDSHSSQTTKRLMWAKGLAAPSEVTLNALEGLRSLTLSFIETYRTRSVGFEQDADPSELARRLLPDVLLSKLGPLTPPQQQALPFFEELVRQDLRRSLVVASPPGVGKTRLGQMAATYATCDPGTGARREGGEKVLVLMPTRALIDEQLEAWEQWLEVPGTEPLLRVVGVSAEHDIYRRDVSAGEFDIAVCVYESAANLLVGPQRARLLSEIALIVVDEWQWMRDDQRGGRLDALLTGLQVNEQSPPPVLLMGPELDRRTHGAAVNWLSASRSVITHRRITTLTLHTASASRELVRTETPDGKATDLESHAWRQPLQKAFGELGGDLKQRLGSLPSKGLPLLLAAKLLSEDDNRRIIVFVAERETAIRCAEAAIALLSQAGIGSEPTGRNPWSSGRFASANDEDPEDRHRGLQAAAPVGEDYDKARWWLMNGVAVHTASIERTLQTLFIDELDDGIARLMFATDTVAEGINVAASHVIVGSTFRGAAGQEELLEPHRVRQRLNRAGRWGRWGNHGHGYLCVPPKAPAAIIDPQVATNPERAFGHFIDTDRGLAVAPGESPDEDRIDRLATIALHHLRQRGGIRTREQMLSDIKAFLERTYLAAYTAKPIADDDALQVIDRLKAQLALEGLDPDVQLPAVVLELLEREQAVAEDEHGSDRLRVTPLGDAIDENAFPLRSARTVRDLHAMLNRPEPPSDLDLICQAAADFTARGRIGWSFTRNRAVETELVERLQWMLGRYAATDPGTDVRQLQLDLACGGGLGRERVVPHQDLFLLQQGRELVAGGPLAGLLESDADLVADTDPGAERRPDFGGHLLMRTLLANEWASFEPRSNTIRRLSTHVFGPSEKRHDLTVRWRVDGPDLRNFVRACAHLLGAAHSLTPRHARAGQLLAERLRRGLPRPLAALDAERLPFAGREYLVRFGREQLSLPTVIEQLNLDGETRAQADRWLVRRAARLRTTRSNLGSRYASKQLIPEGPGVHALTAEGLLHSFTLGELDELERTLEPFDVRREGNVLSVPTTNPDSPLRIVLLDAASLDSRSIPELLGEAPSLLVAIGELSDEVIHADERFVATPAELIRGLIHTEERLQEIERDMGSDFGPDAARAEFGTLLYRYFDRE